MSCTITFIAGALIGVVSMALFAASAMDRMEHCEHCLCEYEDRTTGQWLYENKQARTALRILGFNPDEMREMTIEESKKYGEMLVKLADLEGE